MMIEFEQALKKVLDRSEILGTEELAVDESTATVLAEDIRSKYNIPPFDKSAMDGYACRSIDLRSFPKDLKCEGFIKAGVVCKKALKIRECIKIMTGAPLPKGADSVVMVEDTETGERPGWVKILKGVAQRENVCIRGEDIRKGAVVLKKKRLIRAPEVSLISSLGRKKIRVYRRPEISILNTGDEIAEPGSRLKEGSIFNSNGPMLVSLIKSIGLSVRYLGIAKDDKDHLIASIREGLKSDILILSGGVSAGDFDLVPTALEMCRVTQVFHKINMKPGKPVFFATKGKRLIFGVPGNPVSTFLTFMVLIKPAIHKIMGRMPGLNIRQGVLKRNFQKRPGRRSFYPVCAIAGPAQLEVFPSKGYNGSADMASLSKCNAFMVLDGKTASLKRGSKVGVILW